MALGKFLSGLLGKQPDSKAVEEGPRSKPAPAAMTVDDLFGEMEEGARARAQNAPLPVARGPVPILPSYTPSKAEELALHRRISQGPQAEIDPSEAPTEKEEIDLPFLLPAEKQPKAKGVPHSPAASERRETGQAPPAPKAPAHDQPNPNLQALVSLIESVEPRQQASEDSDIFIPLGHILARDKTPSPDEPRSAMPGLESPKAAEFLAGAVARTPGKPAAMGSVHEVGWGLRLAAKLAAAKRNSYPTPPPDRIRVPRRAMDDSELIPPLYFRRRR